MLTAGVSLGPYRILAPLGAGGMGEVYRARDSRLGRDVAIKVLPAQFSRDPERLKRFEQEARAAGTLNHPNICTLHDLGTHEGAPYVVMELLEGASLRAKLKAGPLPLRKAVDYAAGIARGLAAAHDKGIVHRDLKPENLFVTRDGRVKVLDFGLAKLMRPEVLAPSDETAMSLLSTESGAILGTAGYMAPEQVRGEAADARSDLFALGAILHEMLTGQRAFAGGSFVQAAYATLNHEPAALTSLRAEVPAALESLVRHCLEKEPAQRFQSASDLAFDLENLGSIGAGAASAATALAAPAARRPGRAAIATFVACGLLVLAGAWRLWPTTAEWTGRGGGAPPTTKKEWILVADFEGPRDEPDLARAAQGLMAAALDESGIVMTLPRDQVAAALAHAGRPESTRVVAPLARELAYRNSIRSVLEGHVNRVGSGYKVLLRLSDSGSDSTLLTLDGTARNQDALIPELDRLARRMRRELGEHPAAVRMTRELQVAITPSIEAYRKFVQGSDHWDATQDGIGSMRMSREALALDPDFAAAYSELSVLYGAAFGRPDSAVWACDQALMRPRRLTDEQRLHTEARRAFYRADFEAALQALNRQLQLYPFGPKAAGALNMRALIHSTCRRFEQALEDSRESVARRLIAQSNVALNVLFTMELNANRLDQAEVTASRLPGSFGQTAAVRLAVARDDWARAESLCTRLPAELSADPGVRNQAAAVRFAMRARRGEIRSAREDRGPETFRGQLFLTMVSGAPAPVPPPSLATDSTVAGVITRSWHRSLAGDLAGARRELAELRRRSADDLARAGAAAEFLEASIAAAEGRWSDVIRLIGGVALRGDDRPLYTSWGRFGPTPERWLVAEAYDHLGNPDSAAVAFERVLEPPESRGIAIFVPYAHQRLTMIYARMGRREEAERHWRAFSSVFTHPDPEVKHLLDEARAAEMALRRMAVSDVKGR
jgi:tRNA A-37 threonylcarbamoyl transferase component Bud32/tetratricopeptide (TPR) repeat protein